MIKIRITESKVKDLIPGGLGAKLRSPTMKKQHQEIADKHGVSLEDIEKQIQKGMKVEMEHTSDPEYAHEIAMDHVIEDPKYYDKTHEELEELWSQSERAKRKSKCSNPKGFTMKQFCKNQRTRSQQGEKTNESKDPKVGTGKKPEGSSRRLYTDEDPSDTVSVKFSTVQDIKDTLSKESFKSKSHARQSQIINLIHQRVRAAYENAKDPEVKARLKKALDYAEKRKEASKEKTKANKELDERKLGKPSSETSLRDWFKRKGAPGKKGGWVDCNTCRDGKCKPCGRQGDEKRSKYPRCRPTPAQCKGYKRRGDNLQREEQ